MHDSLIIIENFYKDPDVMREYALSKEFNVSGNYPGNRTDCESDKQRDYLKKYFEDNIFKRPITYWPDGYNTAFQYTTEESDTWVHHDLTGWAGVLYLTPNAPIESGTGIYRHKESGIFEWDKNKPETELNYKDYLKDMSKWEQIAFVGNIYNRLVVYRGSLYHRSVLPGFGKDKYTGRLFQTFFFDTK